jgi:hypothetical protein
MNSASFLIFCKFTWWWPNIRAETCREYRSYIKYFVNCCETEGIIIYSFYYFIALGSSCFTQHPVFKLSQLVLFSKWPRPNLDCLHLFPNIWTFSKDLLSVVILPCIVTRQHMYLIIGLCILLRVYQPIYVETSVRNKCQRSFYCALVTLHVSAPIGGYLQVVCNTKNSKAVTVYVNGSVASVCLTIYEP